MTDDEKRKRILAEAKAHIDGTWRAEDFPHAVPEPSSPMQRTDQVGDLVHKVIENAQVGAAAPAQQLTNDEAWNEWLQRAIDVRLEEERAEWIEILGEIVAKMRSEYQRDADREAEINAEFVKIWRSIEANAKSLVEIRRERVERTLHSELDPAKMN
jgi:hypothetical protein